jgi:hypothetical protein
MSKTLELLTVEEAAQLLKLTLHNRRLLSEVNCRQEDRQWEAVANKQEGVRALLR